MNTWCEHRENVTKSVPGKKVDSFLVTGWADLFYLSGCDLDGYWMLASGDGIEVITPRLLCGQLRDLMRDCRVFSGRDMAAVLADRARKHGFRSVGLDSAAVSIDLADKLRKELPGVTWKRLPDFIRKIRRIKSEEEITAVRESCDLAVRVFKRVRAGIKPGKTEKQVSEEILAGFAENKAESCFKPIVASGINSAYPFNTSYFPFTNFIISND